MDCGTRFGRDDMGGKIATVLQGLAVSLRKSMTKSQGQAVLGEFRTVSSGRVGRWKRRKNGWYGVLGAGIARARAGLVPRGFVNPRSVPEPIGATRLARSSFSQGGECFVFLPSITTTLFLPVCTASSFPYSFSLLSTQIAASSLPLAAVFSFHSFASIPLHLASPAAVTPSGSHIIPLPISLSNPLRYELG